MSKRDRYKHLIDMWCDSPLEDSSSVYCDFCREQNLSAGSTAPLIYPVVCPECLEQELTFRWKRPRKPWFRKLLLKVLELIIGGTGMLIGIVIGVIARACWELFLQARKGWKAIFH